jgi:phage gp36-like protein
VSYAGLDQMIERFGERELIQLTNRPGSAGPLPAEIDQERLAAALKDAADLIDGYLGKRYRLPLNPIPTLAVRWSIDLARWFLQPGAAPEMVKANYERTLTELKEAANGDISLGLPEEDSGGWSGDVQFSGPKRIFDDLTGY